MVSADAMEPVQTGLNASVRTGLERGGGEREEESDGIIPAHVQSSSLHALSMRM